MKFLSLVVLATAASANYLDAVNARRSPNAVEARQPHGPEKSNVPLAARHGPGDYDTPKMVGRSAHGPGDYDTPKATRVVARKPHGPDGDDDHTIPKSTRVVARKPHGPDGDDDHTGGKKEGGYRRRQVPQPKASAPTMPEMPGMAGMGHS
ncbi:hypothetical protein EG328_002821 [Venturia inaequalis]|uniref:Uncharacterized protein n=1 Tax=Venturia inaequalis TaxID=5025 RepID=A0A8H3UVK9_VENIN|nr:hypothetical protein EG328_002821 [Venturia inaequalis]RDI81551.1 hypothetical protein Vi05172_g8349 [Venturia inaequalis]